MNQSDITVLLRKIFVEEDIKATKDSLLELNLLASNYSNLEDEQRNQVFYFSEENDRVSLSRKYTDSDCNILSVWKAKNNIDIIKLNVECIALEKQLERNSVVFKIFSLMRNLINENIGLYYPVDMIDGVIYESNKISVKHHMWTSPEGNITINMVVNYTDKENNMMYSCEYLVNENQNKSYIIQTLSGI